MTIETQANIMEFFREMVLGALRNQSVEASQMTEFYLVNLLVEYTARSPDIDEPLALRLKRAQLAAETEERIRLLKELGDCSLYMSGFFGESLSRGLVDVDYYIAMGGRAYENLSNVIQARPNGGAFRDLYGELAEKFPRFVDVLTEVSEHTALGSGKNRGLVELYERWLRTGSERIAARLREQGVLPARKDPSGMIH